MMAISKKIALLFAGAAVLVLFGEWPAHVTHAAGCDFTAPLGQLSAIQNDWTLTDHDRLIKELNFRKQVLNDVLTCATNDAASFKSQLAETSPADNASVRIKSQLMNQIDISLGYYDLKKSAIGDLGLQGTKDIAKEISSWRRDAEIPLETQISAFLLWSKNQPTIASAQNRLSQISNTLIGLDLSSSGDIPKNLADAKSEIAAAVTASGEAQMLIVSGESQGAIDTITNYLTDLKNAYEDFFLISETVQKTFSQK